MLYIKFQEFPIINRNLQEVALFLSIIIQNFLIFLTVER